MKNTMICFLVGIISVLSLTGTVTTSYSEIDSSIFDDLDGEPESLDYFTEKGFKIATLHDRYGDYFIPYKMDGIINSVMTDDPGLTFLINVTQSEVILLVPFFYLILVMTQN